MSSPYVGQIMMFGGNFAPAGWAFCNGQPMAISQNDTLFNLIGTTYGGDGQETFNLPDLQGRMPVHMGQSGSLQSYAIGEQAGVEQVTLTTAQIPLHNHAVDVESGQPGSASVPASNLILADEGQNGAQPANVYVPNNTTNQVALTGATIGVNGGSQPHSNIQPLLVINFIISLYGVYPSPT